MIIGKHLQRYNVTIILIVIYSSMILITIPIEDLNQVPLVLL